MTLPATPYCQTVCAINALKGKVSWELRGHFTPDQDLQISMLSAYPATSLYTQQGSLALQSDFWPLRTHGHGQVSSFRVMAHQGLVTA